MAFRRILRALCSADFQTQPGIKFCSMALNRLPFEFRFNPCYKLFHEIENHLDELDEIVRQYLIHLQTKRKIVRLLEDNFNHFNDTLKLIHEYSHSEHCQIDDHKLIELIDLKIRHYQEDLDEYSKLKNLKPVQIVLNKLPDCWKCLTWKDEESLRNYAKTMNALQQKPEYQQRLNENNLGDQRQPSHVEDEQNEQLKEINQLLSSFDDRIESFKRKVLYQDELILLLFNSSKEYLKVFLKIELDLSELNDDDLNDQSAIILEEILKRFQIDEQIDFWSKSPDAYTISGNDDLRVKLKQPPETIPV